MSETAHRPGPWSAAREHVHRACMYVDSLIDNHEVAVVYAGRSFDEAKANALLIAAAPDQNAEMLRFLPVLERAEANPEIWEKLTKGTGIATANSFRAALAKADGRS